MSASIDKYCYISCRFLPPFFKYKHRIVYSQQENVSKINDIDHPSVRECMRYAGIKDGLEIHHDGDLPAMSGLGSSSAFTVGFLNALSGLTGGVKNKRQLALDAIHVEQNLIKENVGSQDQTAVAFGGLNRIDFGGTKEISVKPLLVNSARLEALPNHLMLFFTGLSRDASKTAKEQIENIKDRNSELRLMHQIVDEGTAIITNSKRNLDEFGKLLNETWKVKKSLSSKITNPYLDAIYDTGKQAGALGGKLLGAGGGGFMLFFAPPERHKKIKEKLKKFLYVPINFDYMGSQVIYNSLDKARPKRT